MDSALQDAHARVLPVVVTDLKPTAALSEYRLFHGSLSQMAVGDLILPPTMTWRVSTRDLGYPQCRRDRVYATPYFLEGCSFAMTRQLPFDPRFSANRAYAGRGWVYLVQPLGDWDFDSDYEADDPRWAVAVEAARILAVCRPPKRVAKLREQRERQGVGQLPMDACA